MHEAALLASWLWAWEGCEQPTGLAVLALKLATEPCPWPKAKPKINKQKVNQKNSENVTPQCYVKREAQLESF